MPFAVQAEATVTTVPLTDKKDKSKDSGVSWFGVAKQWGLQKLGKASATVESEQFQNMVKAFNVSRQELAELLERSQELLKLNESVVDAESNFSSTMAKLGSHSKADQKAAETVQSFVPTTLVLQSAFVLVPRRTCCLNLLSFCSAPQEVRRFAVGADREAARSLAIQYACLDSRIAGCHTRIRGFRADEVKKTVALLKKLDTVRLDYDAKHSKVSHAAPAIRQPIASWVD